MKLEELLNKLIEEGNYYRFGLRTKEIKVFGKQICMIQQDTLKNEWIENRYSLNDLCSLDSGLWQFVCEKGLYDDTSILGKHDYIQLGNFEIPQDQDEDMQREHPKFRLMLSSIQEDKENFLLDNIALGQH